MIRLHSSRSPGFCAYTCMTLALILMAGCSPPVQKAVGPAAEYTLAKDYFAKGNLDRAIEHTESLSKGSPPNEYTDRARVLRAVIFSGQLKGYKELTDAYAKGLDETKNSLAKTAFAAQRRDDLQHGAQIALYLAQAAHLLTQGGTLPDNLTLDAPYPTSEGPTVVTQLTRVIEGGMVGPDDLAAASVDAQCKGVNDAVAEVLGGDRAQARTALQAGPAKLDAYKFSLFLSRQLWNASGIFDRKHLHDLEKYRILSSEADEAAKVALATFKEKPDKEKAKEVKKIQDGIKAGLKNI